VSPPKSNGGGRSYSPEVGAYMNAQKAKAATSPERSKNTEARLDELEKQVRASRQKIAALESLTNRLAALVERLSGSPSKPKKQETDDERELDARTGARRASGPHMVGNVHVFPTMTPTEARRLAEKKNGTR